MDSWANNCPFWFPILRSYTVISHPSRLEYPLSSSYPVSGWLSKRFSISGEVWVCPTLPVLRQNFFRFHSPMVIGYCPVLRVFGSSCLFLFSSKVLHYFSRIFTMWAGFQPEDSKIIAQSPPKRGGFEPNFPIKIEQDLTLCLVMDKMKVFSDQAVRSLRWEPPRIRS